MKPLTGTDADIARAATPVFEQVLRAHESDDYTLLQGLLSAPPPGQDGLTEQVFKDAVQTHLQPLGPSAEKTYLGSLRKPACTLAVWKVRYPQTDQELLWQLFIGVNDADGKEVMGIFFS